MSNRRRGKPLWSKDCHFHDLKLSANQMFQQSIELRRFCAVCGCRDPNRLIQCIHCSMIFYCSTEHRLTDGNVHRHVCSILKSCRLGLQSTCLPAIPPLPPDGDWWKWRPSQISSWEQWFKMRPQLRKAAEKTSIVLNAIYADENEEVDEKLLKNDDAVNSLMQAVTEYMTYPLSLGKALYELRRAYTHTNNSVLVYLMYNKKIGYKLGDTLQDIAMRFQEVSNMLSNDVSCAITIVGEDIPSRIHVKRCTLSAKLSINCLKISMKNLLRNLNRSSNKQNNTIPDLIAAFDCIGEDWPTILQIASLFAIPVYVSFTHLTDIKKFVHSNFGNSLLTDKQRNDDFFKNLFASKLPQQDYASPNLIYYTNMYHQLIVTSCKKRRSCSVPRQLAKLPTLLINQQSKAEEPQRRSLRSIKANSNNYSRRRQIQRDDIKLSNSKTSSSMEESVVQDSGFVE